MSGPRRLSAPQRRAALEPPGGECLRGLTEDFIRTRNRRGISSTRLVGAGRGLWHVLLLVGALFWAAGCATGSALREAERALERESLADDGGGFGFLEEKRDEFQLLQQSSGLEEEAWHEEGEELETEDAQELWEELVRTRTTLNNFGAKRSLLLVLRQVLEADEDVPYAELVGRCRRLRPLVVMRPDGYLVRALDGVPLQRMGKVELREGRLQVGGRYEVGAFYWNRMAVFYPVDGALRQASEVPLGEVGLERDWLNAALDGTEDALVEVVVALAHIVTEPVRSLQGLAQLPSAVAVLIATSPEYFARYSALPLQEQIREAGRLSTHLLMLFGSAAGTATRVGATGTRLPVLTLSADGALALERVMVPAGNSAMVLGAGAGAVYVLSSSEKAPDRNDSAAPAAEGPGEWRHKKFSGSERSMRYQEQISGRSADEVYFIGRVEYDGFDPGLLKEAKAEGYLAFFHKDGKPRTWYEASGEYDGLMKQAREQAETARINGMRLQWHVAEPEMVRILQINFRRQRIENIELIHTSPLKDVAP
jgi:hypothetical protein